MLSTALCIVSRWLCWKQMHMIRREEGYSNTVEKPPEPLLPLVLWGCGCRCASVQASTCHLHTWNLPEINLFESDIDVKSPCRQAADCRLYWSSSGRRARGIAVNNLTPCFSKFRPSLRREINNLCQEGWILIYLCLYCCTKRRCILLLEIKQMQMLWLWNGNDCETSQVSQCDCHNSRDLYSCLRQHW